MLRSLKFARWGSPRPSRRTSLRLLALKCPLRIFDPLLRSTQLLRSDKHARSARRRTAGHCPARLVPVPIGRDTPHTDVAGKRDGSRGRRVVTDQRVVEDKCDIA